MNIKVVRGNPTPQELAAALAVVTARATAAASVPERPAQLNQWADKKHLIPRHAPAQPGPTTWRTSHWPR